MRSRRLRKRALRIIHRLHAHQALRSTTCSHRLRSLQAAHRLRRLRAHGPRATALEAPSCPSIPRRPHLRTVHRQLPLHPRHLAQHGVMARSPRDLQCRQALRLLESHLQPLSLPRTGLGACGSTSKCDNPTPTCARSTSSGGKLGRPVEQAMRESRTATCPERAGRRHIHTNTRVSHNHSGAPAGDGSELQHLHDGRVSEGSGT